MSTIKWEATESTAILGRGSIWIRRRIATSPTRREWAWHVADFDRDPGQGFLAEGEAADEATAKRDAAAAARPIIEREEKEERARKDEASRCSKCRRKWAAHFTDAAGKACLREQDIEKARALLAEVDGGSR
jgi:hypothetical protein